MTFEETFAVRVMCTYKQCMIIPLRAMVNELYWYRQTRRLVQLTVFNLTKAILHRCRRLTPVLALDKVIFS